MFEEKKIKQKCRNNQSAHQSVSRDITCEILSDDQKDYLGLKAI